MKIFVLGCGSSLGVPVVGCQCAVCSSGNPRNKRMRSSICVQTGDNNILIDTSPDLRVQLFDNGITRVNHVLYTHEHADHCHGIDELRIMRIRSQPVTVYGTEEVVGRVYQKFSYMFSDSGSDIGFIKHQYLDWYGSVEIEGVKFESYKQMHGAINSTGYKIGRTAYSTDTNFLPEESLNLLIGNIDTFIVGCIGYERHNSHANLEQCLSWVDLIKPKRTILTHLGHHVDYDELLAMLPEGVVPAYDGMVITI